MVPGTESACPRPTPLTPQPSPRAPRPAPPATIAANISRHTTNSFSEPDPNGSPRMGLLISAFWNRDERRLRAGWRLLIQFIVFIVVAAGGQLGVALAFGRKSTIGLGVMSVLYLAGEAGAAWIIARFIDRRRFAAYGLHINFAWWLDLAFGLLVGALMISGIFLVEWLAGWVTVSAPLPPVSGTPLLTAILVALLFFVAVGFNEEFMFRGYHIRNLAEGLLGRRIGPRAAIATAWFISAALFGLAHAVNPGATAVSSINIMLTAGGVLGLAYVLTGELAIPIGIHITWNFFEGTVYGFAVSGTSPDASLIHLEQGGPKLWTGGAFGPEAGLLCTISCTIALVLVALWVRTRHRELAFDTDLARYTPRVRSQESTISEQPVQEATNV
jgi:membrane protease YdiL (CAAX protease family)